MVPLKHSLVGMRRTAFHPSTICWERDGQRRVSEIQTWSKHLLHVCLCLKGEGKVFWGTPQNLEGMPSMVALIDKYPDPKRLLWRHPHLLHKIQSVRCFEAMTKSRKIQKKTPYFTKTKILKSVKVIEVCMKCTLHQNQNRWICMRYFGMRFNTVGPVLYANKIPPEMPGWSAGYNPWCNVSAICFQRDNFGRVCQVGK